LRAPSTKSSAGNSETSTRSVFKPKAAAASP
jgi:hypothetical protein